MFKSLISRAGNGPVELVDFDKEFKNVFDDMNRMIGNVLSGTPFYNRVMRSGFPKANIRREGDDGIFEVVVPYYEPENIDVNLADDNILTITGKAVEGEGKYELQEVAKRAFQRSWPVNNGAKPEDVSAEYDKGVLYVRVKGMYGKKKEQYEGHKIEVKKKA